jgi:hypothetical protein
MGQLLAVALFFLACAPAAAQSDLTFGISWVGKTDPDYAADNIRRVSRLPNVVPLIQERENPGVDVVVRLTYEGSTLNIETFTARSHAPLTKGKASWWTQAAGWKGVSEHLKTEFAPGTEAHKAALAEREAAAPAAGGLTKGDLAELVKQAVAAAAPPAGGAPPAAAGLSSAVDAPTYKAAGRPQDYAVVIGIESYSDLPSASFAERDAAAVRAHLAALGVPERNIVSLTGPKAGKAAFVKTLETWLPKQVDKDSTVWFYFSGHGAPDPRSGQAFLLPWDGDPQFLDDTAYPLKRLYEKLNALPAKRAVAFVDSCFSGAGGRSVLAKGLRPLVTVIDVGEAKDKVAALTASSPEQVSGTAESEGHGLFTYHLLAGLNGAAADKAGRVSLKGLFEYLSPKVADDARRQNREQTPRLWVKDEDAAAVLMRP